MENAIRRNNIKKVRKALGLNQQQLAEMAGVGVPQISRWENGLVDLPMSRLRTLAEGLGVDVSLLVYSDGPVTLPTQALAERPMANGTPIKMEGASAERMREDLPIYGTALGANRDIGGEAIEQTYLNSGDVIGYAKRPTLLNGNAAAYGVYVAGSSMEPRYFDGEMVLADPRGRIRSGEDVIVYLRTLDVERDDGNTARAVLVKRLIRRTADYVELQQYQPNSVFRVDAADVVRIDRVVPWQELIG